MLRRTIMAIALALPLAPGCSKQGKLTEVEVPEAGVSMRYDLTPGQEYDGHIRMRNAAQTPLGDIVTVVEFDAKLVVSAKTQGGGALVRARVDGIKLDLRLPDGVPAEAVGLTQEAATALNGKELGFDLTELGEVSNEPEPPPDAPMESKTIFTMIASAVTAGFVRVPEQPIKDGETWDAAPRERKPGVTSMSSTGTLGGLGRNEAGEDIAKLELASEAEMERDGQQVKMKQSTKAAFSATGGYPVSVKRTINNEIVGKATLLIEIEAEWAKGGKQAVEASPPPAEVQAITDPCDPDYVGAEECADEATPATEG
ncbi:hypothetical protein [Paraliomyxa miuraensis]|uniref:hypothetical protein n=1 Tax=Paraliomyxa miuraensis TaxID=376150 RepID=UPI00224EE737|nr:hypothetical protein [Paraliomyxa miuraensis]MCX4241507.1 hypothetical protein [Paraliomyxa miuraensis]